MQLTTRISGSCDLQIILSSVIIVSVTIFDHGRDGRFDLRFSFRLAEGGVFFRDYRLLNELDSPLMFTLVSHQRSRKADGKKIMVALLV